MIKSVVFGDTLLPQEFMIGLETPQTEISVWLHGSGRAQDVTARMTLACTAPMVLCVGFHEAEGCSEDSFRRAVLKFCRRGGSGHVLGEIRLRPLNTITIGTSRFVLFAVRGSTNYCLPRLRLWPHYVLQAYDQWRRDDPPDVRMTLLEFRASMVTFIRPHPLWLVSVGDRSSGNIFTMNLMGDLGNGYLGFALRHLRVVADVAERAGRVAICGIPFAQCGLAYQLAGNYKKESVDWAALPFHTAPSDEFGIPVPDFATIVRELEIAKVHKIGSHRLFIARIIRDEPRAGGLQACAVHGFYQFWRTKGDKKKLSASLAEHLTHQRGF